MDLEDWVAAMDAEPGNTVLMLIVADWLEEQGKPGAAEAMRLLGEAGKVGTIRNDGVTTFSYWSIETKTGDLDWVCGRWFARADSIRSMWKIGIARTRVQLAEAWEQANQATRDAWRRETFSQAIAAKE
jgi:uncharacterized protein (TIGR02996 family)